MKTPLSRKPHFFRYLLIGFFNPPYAGVEAPRR
jgi:hypothetical protein